MSEPVDHTLEASADQTFGAELTALLNKHSRENKSNTPDFLLARFMLDCLRSWERSTRGRDEWFGVELSPGRVSFVKARKDETVPSIALGTVPCRTMATHQHFMRKCRNCDTVVVQCRCPSKDKTIEWADDCPACRTPEGPRQ